MDEDQHLRKRWMSTLGGDKLLLQVEELENIGFSFMFMIDTWIGVPLAVMQT